MAKSRSSRSRSRSRSPPLIRDHAFRAMVRAKRDISPSREGLLPLAEKFRVKRFESIAMELRSGRKLATTCPCCLGKGSNANIFRWCRKCFKERVRGLCGRKVYGDPLRRVSGSYPPWYVPDPAKSNRKPYFGSEEDADVWVNGVLVHSRKKKDGKKKKDGQAIGDQSGCGPADELTGVTKEGTKKDEQANGETKVDAVRPKWMSSLVGLST